MLGCALLPLFIETPLIWPCVFIWGAVSYGIYTMSIIELGERFTGSALVAGNAAFSLMWGVGGIAVPPLAGGAMDVIGASGLPDRARRDLPRIGGGHGPTPADRMNAKSSALA